LSIVQNRISVLKNSTDPRDQEMLRNLQMQEQNLQQGYGASLNNERLLRGFRNDSANADSILPLATAYVGTIDFQPEARRLLNKTLSVRPGDTRAQKLLDSLTVLEQKRAAPPVSPK
jgi:hypothetical protein